MAQIPRFNRDIFFFSILLNVFAALFSITPVKRLSFLVSASNSQVVTAILLCTLLKYSDLHDQWFLPRDASAVAAAALCSSQ